MRSETAGFIDPSEMKFVQSKNGTRFYSESEILDLLEAADEMGVLDSGAKTLRVSELERLLNSPV